MRVVIIGAGLSGMTSAWELSKQGHEVVVLEARDRVGGRTWSQRLDNGEVTERGGEYIFPTEFAIRRLSAEVGVPIMSHGVRYARRTYNGKHQTYAEFSQSMADAKSTLQTMMNDGAPCPSLNDVFEATVGQGFTQHPLYRRLATSYAADPAKINALSVFLHDAGDDDGPHIEDGGHFVGGNQSLTIELARRLGSVVRLESPIAAVEQSASRVQVTLRDGSTVDGDAAIVTVPFPILQGLPMNFELSEAMQSAMSHRFMGVAAKLGVPVSRVDDDVALGNAEHMWWSWRSLSIDGTSRINAISSFAGSPSAFAGLDISAGRDGWVDALHKMRPEMEIAGEVVFTDWEKDEWTLGAYTAPNLDWKPEDDHAFTEAVGRVAFAGEHTGSSQSLTGAVESGYRAVSALEKVFAKN
jgi:monoamine oxidase